MDLHTGRSSQPEGPAPLRVVPAGDPAALTSAVTDDGGLGDAPQGLGEDLQEDLALLRDAATLVTARRRLDGLLLQLAANPFDPDAYRGLGSYLVGPGRLALAAYERVSASTVRGG